MQFYCVDSGCITNSVDWILDWVESNSVCNHKSNKIGRVRSGSLICLLTSMITDQIGRHEVLLPINHNHYNFRENKCIPFFVKVLLIPSIERNTSQIHPFWKVPSLVGSAVGAPVIVIGFVIGGLSWEHLIWLADVTDRFQVSDYITNHIIHNFCRN